MALYYTWSADVVALGATLKIDVTDDGGAFTINLTSGVNNHEDISAIVSGTSTWAAVLKAALDAGSASETYTVGYSAPASNIYNIKCTGTVLELDFSTSGDAYTKTASLLGYNATNHTGTAAGTGYDSDINPYYTVVPQVAGRSTVDPEYMPSGNAADAEADDGTSYGVMRGTSPVYTDWSQVAETRAATFKVSAAAATPWTWQHAWEHAGNVQPFLVNDGTERAIHKLRAGGAAFFPKMLDAADYDNLWSVPFATRLLGRL